MNSVNAVSALQFWGAAALVGLLFAFAFAAVLAISFAGARRMLVQQGGAVVARVLNARELVFSLFRPEVSLVIPYFNAAGYVDNLLTSIFNQSRLPRRFEIIVVDDGSTDSGGARIAQWAAKHPGVIRYVFQENQGAAGARNTGLALAKGKWVGFPDADDMLDKDFFSQMLPRSRRAFGTVALVSNVVFYREVRHEREDTHPLRARFQGPSKRLRLPNLAEKFFHAVNHTWVRRSAVRRAKLEFDSRVRPTFEDGHFLNRLFLHHHGSYVELVPEAIYLYRKRAAMDSLVDGALATSEWFNEQLEFGYLSLFREATSRYGVVPRYLQRLCLYEIVWRLRWVMDQPSRVAHLEKVDLMGYQDKLGEIVRQLDPQVIEKFALAKMNDQLRVGLLWNYQNKRKDLTFVYLEQIDNATNDVQFGFFRGATDNVMPEIRLNGELVEPQNVSHIPHKHCGEVFSVRTFFWVPMSPGDVIGFEMNGKACSIRHGAVGVGSHRTFEQIQEALVPGVEEQRIRSLIISGARDYSGCLVFMDSGDRADDNAEHLYRYFLDTGQADAAYFVLARDSKDWDRLAAEGFHLLEWNSDEHVIALMNSSVFVSSHADHHLLWPVPQKWVEDLARYQFVFLQHGVIKEDLSEWLNTKPIRFFVTTTLDEALSISAIDSPYKFSEREVIQTGLPRHDALLAKALDREPQHIVLMPTWRRYLTDESARSLTGERQKLANFLETDWATHWLGLLKSPRLQEMAADANLSVVWAPHPNMAMYSEDMAPPDWVTVVDVRRADYQELFANTRVAVTDYSSASFDVAFLDRPIVYFQFDKADIPTAGHIWTPGYFSYEDHGFGPVALTVDDALDGIEKALTGGEDERYALRRRETFTLKDGNCSARVAAKISEIR